MDEILVNTTTAGLQHQPAITWIDNTHFVVVWTDYRDGNIKGAMFDTAGRRSGDEFIVNTPTPTETNTKRELPSVSPMPGFLPGPAFAVVWIEHAWRPPGPVPHLKLQVFDEAGRKLGPEVQVSTERVDPQSRPVMGKLIDAKHFFVVWVDADPRRGIRGQVFHQDGPARGVEFRVNTSEGVHLAPVATGLDDASFVVAWQGGETHGRTRPRLQIFEPDGSKVGPEKTPNLAAFKGEMAIAAVQVGVGEAPGQFVIPYVSDAGEQRLVVAALFGRDGTFAHALNVTHREEQSIASHVTTAALGGGGFVVAWTAKKVAHVGDRTGENIRATVFSAQGPIGSPAQVNTTSEGNQFSPCVTPIVADREFIAFAWTDDSKRGGDLSDYAVKMRILTDRLRPV